MKSIPDHQLDAFVDDQLSQTDRANILDAMESSGDARNKVAETRRLKDLLRLAYQNQRPNPAQFRFKYRKFASHAIAAACGALSMLVLLEVMYTPPPDPQLHQQAGAASESNLLAAGSRQPEQVLFHLSSDDQRAAQLLLDQVELVASQYARANRELRLIVVTNNLGLRLFQVGQSQQAERIGQLYRKYDNIVFAACGTTIGKQAAAGEKVELLPEVIVIDSGVAELTRRQQNGWKYIRI